MSALALLLALVVAPATINGKPISKPEVDKAAREYIRSTYFHAQLSDAQIAEIQKKMLAELVVAELRAQEARRRGLQVPKEPLDKLAAGEEKAAGGAQKFEATLTSWGIDRARYREVIERPALAEKLAAVATGELPAVTEAEALAHYKANLPNYLIPSAVRLRGTCVRVDPSSDEKRWKAAELEAGKLREEAAKGDFAIMALERNCDKYGPKGGDMGLVHQNSLEPAMEKAVWAVKDGDITPPIRTLRGYYLVKREATQPSRQAEFSEVRQSILADLRDKRKEATLKKLDERLRASAKVVVNLK